MFTVLVAMETLWIFSHGHLKYGPPGWNHAHLRVGVALPLLGAQSLGDGIVERGLASRHALGAAEAGLHRALVLIHRVHAHHQVADHEPGRQSKQHSNQNWHTGSYHFRYSGMVTTPDVEHASHGPRSAEWPVRVSDAGPRVSVVNFSQQLSRGTRAEGRSIYSARCSCRTQSLPSPCSWRTSDCPTRSRNLLPSRLPCRVLRRGLRQRWSLRRRQLAQASGARPGFL